MIDLNCVKIEGLEELLSKLTGIKIKFDVAISMSKVGNHCYLVIDSQDIKEHVGIMTPIYKSLVLSNFGGGVSADGTGYWVPIHFSYDYNKGGSNGAHYGDFWYEFETNEWRQL